MDCLSQLINRLTNYDLAGLTKVCRFIQIHLFHVSRFSTSPMTLTLALKNDAVTDLGGKLVGWVKQTAASVAII